MVKDPSTALNDNLYKVYLYSHSGLGEDFFPNISPSDCASGESLSNLKKYQATLLKFNVHVEAILEKIGGSFFIRQVSFAMLLI